MKNFKEISSKEKYKTMQQLLAEFPFHHFSHSGSLVLEADKVVPASLFANLGKYARDSEKREWLLIDETTK